MNSWLKKSLALYSANGLNFILNILIIPILVYYIGFQGYGFYSVYIILSSTLLFLDSALSKSTVSAIHSAKKVDATRVVNASRVAYITAGFLMLVASPLIANGISLLFPLRTDSLNLAYWIGIAAVVEYVLALPGQYFQMLNVLRARHFVYAQYQLCIQLSRFVTVAVVAATTQQIEWVLAAVVLRKIPDYLILWLFWRRQQAELHAPAQWPMVITLFRQASPIVGLALLQVLGTEFISIYVSHAYGAETLGKYRSVYDVLNKIWFVATLYPVLIYPKICEWLADRDKRVWLKNTVLYLNLGSALFYGLLTLCGIALYPVLAQWVPALQDAAPFAAGLLAGICMSGHVRLGYEFLQAQRDAGTALLVNLLSIGAGAAVLFALYGHATKEIGWAWFVSQLLAVVIVDIRNCILLSNPIKKSVTGLLPWLGVTAGVFWTCSGYNSMANTLTTLFLIGAFMVGMIALAKQVRDLRQI
ncbi:oligosaccharide flippase family protein [Pseudomonas putida]|jgi:O-antigen/teichoic acid export membrane protein|uniref:oligosaccharide flippase family protein n=1 Tax=Pseudomonas TaxID=286 RepID=UPI000BA30A96|nr:MULTISPECIES: oligosaccharide flippase family protein [Pseudomonas]MCO7628133.1 oligosaccharide flippase family protein [Pseudomonas fluorescens]NHX01326.1 oligosaccharide flippase family protein [Pseudomonas koreensis]